MCLLFFLSALGVLGVTLEPRSLAALALEAAALAASAFFVAYAKLLGDMNCDNKIDIIDVATVAYAYNTRPGDARWNLIADLDNDGVVDITDVATVAFYYGTSA